MNGADGPVFGITKEVQIGNPDIDKVSTSYVERVNLTIRSHLRRCGRRTGAHSKKWRNHAAAIALLIAFYNWCRVHETAFAFTRLVPVPKNPLDMTNLSFLYTHPLHAGLRGRIHSFTHFERKLAQMDNACIAEILGAIPRPFGQKHTAEIDGRLRFMQQHAQEVVRALRGVLQ